MGCGGSTCAAGRGKRNQKDETGGRGESVDTFSPRDQRARTLTTSTTTTATAARFRRLTGPRRISVVIIFEWSFHAKSAARRRRRPRTLRWLTLKNRTGTETLCPVLTTNQQNDKRLYIDRHCVH